MYSFNDFQIETNAPSIYSLYIDESEQVLNNIKNAFKSIFSSTDESEKLRKLNKFATNAGYVGFGLCATSALMGGSLFPLVMCTATIFFNEYISKKQEDTIEKTSEKAAKEIYDLIVEHLTKLMENYDELEISDDQIHEMTQSLQEGEFDAKYSHLREVGKCPIYIVSAQNTKFANDCMFPIVNPALSRLYEIVMHIAYNAEEGYEALVREGYHLIKNYSRYMEIKEAPKDLKEALEQRVQRYESKISSRSR